MKLRTMLALGIAVLSLGAVPVMAGAVEYETPEYQPEKPPQTPQGPKKPPKGKAYGYYCRGESKKHVKGQQGTDFSRCVKAMARAAKNPELHPKKACKALSKKHVKGQKGTPFSICVKGVNQLRQEQNATVTASSVA